VEGGFILQLSTESGNRLSYAAQVNADGKVSRVAIYHLD
jgi:hypothetical protein